MLCAVFWHPRNSESCGTPRDSNILFSLLLKLSDNSYIESAGLTIQTSGGSRLFYIVGVYDTEESDDEEDSNTTTALYIPMATAKAMSGSDEGYSSITVVTAVGTDTARFMTTTEEYFASYYTRNDTWTVSASSMEELLSTVTEMIEPSHWPSPLSPPFPCW